MSGGQRVIAPVTVTDLNAGRTYLTPDDPALHPLHTDGDEFSGATLDAAWTPRNMAGGDITFPTADPAVRLNLSAAGDGIWRPAPSGDFEIVASLRGGLTTAQGHMTGPAIVDVTGAGIGTSWYPDSGGSIWNWVLSAYNYSASGNNVTSLVLPSLGMPYWLALRKTGTSYTARGSKDGTTWTAFTAAQVSAITPAFIGVGRFVGTVEPLVDLRRFNVYPGPTFYVP